MRLLIVSPFNYILPSIADYILQVVCMCIANASAFSLPNLFIRYQFFHGDPKTPHES